MSAFMVTKTTITKALDGIFNCTYGVDGQFAKRQNAAAYDKLGRDIARMNEEALAARYGEPVEGIYDDYIYPMRYGATPLEHSIKACDCILYQCAEGDVYQSPFYMALEEYKAELMKDVVRKLPEYDSAPWDWPEENVQPNNKSREAMAG